MLRKLLLLAFVTVALAELELQDVDCSKRPRVSDARMCCHVPEHVIWGNFSETFKTCFKEIQKRDKYNPSARMVDVTSSADGDMPRATEESGPSASSWLSGIMKKIVDLFKKLLKAIQDTLRDALEHYKHFLDDGCLVECVFQKQGLVTEENKINKDKVLVYIKKSLEKEEKWLPVAENALLRCLDKPAVIPVNQTCQSGAAELVSCMSQEMFHNCPDWPQGIPECDNLKRHMDICPNSTLNYILGRN